MREEAKEELAVANLEAEKVFALVMTAIKARSRLSISELKAFKAEIATQIENLTDIIEGNNIREITLRAPRNRLRGLHETLVADIADKVKYNALRARVISGEKKVSRLKKLSEENAPTITRKSYSGPEQPTIDTFVKVANILKKLQPQATPQISKHERNAQAEAREDKKAAEQAIAEMDRIEAREAKKNASKKDAEDILARWGPPLKSSDAEVTSEEYQQALAWFYSPEKDDHYKLNANLGDVQRLANRIMEENLEKQKGPAMLEFFASLAKKPQD